MSCGCVCFGSNTAGIPELLDEKQVFERKNVEAIAETISNTLLNDDLNSISKRNTVIAKTYLVDDLNKKRFAYYNKIKKEINGPRNEN